MILGNLLTPSCLDADVFVILYGVVKPGTCRAPCPPRLVGLQLRRQLAGRACAGRRPHLRRLHGRRRISTSGERRVRVLRAARVATEDEAAPHRVLRVRRRVSLGVRQCLAARRRASLLGWSSLCVAVSSTHARCGLTGGRGGATSSR